MIHWPQVLCMVAPLLALGKGQGCDTGDLGGLGGRGQALLHAHRYSNTLQEQGQHKEMSLAHSAIQTENRVEHGKVFYLVIFCWIVT